jgi:pilus assembly protein Flp/PilA
MEVDSSMASIKIIYEIMRDEQASSAIEYGLILSMIVLAIFAALQNFSAENMRTWTTVSNATSAAVALSTSG